ncbi:unnamed protein product [Paramecium octaurelia]|uniref:Uncharacterized protein n=1 Tax=Paramecium octaurelia TaxID=43137 RepID=A0A8S1V9H4_PAROT|nr:unnamed protein product [Paramecium octaurelia]
MLTHSEMWFCLQLRHIFKPRLQPMKLTCYQMQQVLVLFRTKMTMIMHFWLDTTTNNRVRFCLIFKHWKTQIRRSCIIRIKQQLTHN